MDVLWIMLAKTMSIKYFNVETWMLFAPPYRSFWLRACSQDAQGSASERKYTAAGGDIQVP